MASRQWARTGILVVAAALLTVGCDSSSDPQSPSNASSISGTVVFDQSGAAASNVDVTFERCTGEPMMMHDEWDHSQHMMTDLDGRFHFEYMHESQHRYRVRVNGSSPDAMCYLNGGVEKDIVLRVQDP